MRLRRSSSQMPSRSRTPPPELGVPVDERGRRGARTRVDEARVVADQPCLAEELADHEPRRTLGSRDDRHAQLGVTVAQHDVQGALLVSVRAHPVRTETPKPRAHLLLCPRDRAVTPRRQVMQAAGGPSSRELVSPTAADSAGSAAGPSASPTSAVFRTPPRRASSRDIGCDAGTCADLVQAGPRGHERVQREPPCCRTGRTRRTAVASDRGDPCVSRYSTPDVFDRRVIEVALQRPEAGDRVVDDGRVEGRNVQIPVLSCQPANASPKGRHLDEGAGPAQWECPPRRPGGCGRGRADVLQWPATTPAQRRPGSAGRTERTTATTPRHRER